MASLITGQKRKVPAWVWRLRHAEACLLRVLKTLREERAITVAEDVLRDLDIELRELSFLSGATRSSGQLYFMPRTDGSCSFASSRRAPTFDDDPFLIAQNCRKSGIETELPLHSHLFAAFQHYAFTVRQSECFAWGWKPIMQGDKDVEVFEAGAVRPYFMVNLEAQTATVHQCHRQIWMQSYEQIDNGRLSRVELNVLGSWMLGAMNSQRRHIKSAGRRKISKAHHVFPTMVISFQPPARARILYAYFDGRIKVYMTKTQDFDGPDYWKKMDRLLQWAWPLLFGRTSRITPMPTILESDEVSDEETQLPMPTILGSNKDSHEENPPEQEESVKRPDSPKRHGIVKRVCLFVGNMHVPYPGKRQVPMHTVNHACQVKA